MIPRSSVTRRDFLERSLQLGAAGLMVGPLALASAASAAGDAGNNGWKIGCYTRPWSQFECRVALDAIAKAGFKYAGLMLAKSKNNLIISVDTTAEEAHATAKDCQDRGLKVPSVYGGDIPVATSVEAGIQGLRRLIDCCAIVGAENLMLSGIGDEKLYDGYCKAIGECCDYAAQKGLGISFKPHGGLNANGAQCRKIIEKIGNKNFRIWYDPGNIFFYSDGKLDPVEDAAAVDGLVVGMSVKDFKPPKEVMLTPGTGQVDFPKVMDRLKKGGFTSGALIVECLAPGDPTQLLAEAKKARQFVEQLVGQQG